MKRLLFTRIKIGFLYLALATDASNIRGLDTTEQSPQNVGDGLDERPVKDWLTQGDGTVRIIAKYGNVDGKRAAKRAAISVTEDLTKYSILAFTLPNAEAADRLWQNRGLLTMDNDNEMQALDFFDDGGESFQSDFTFASEAALKNEIKPYGISSVQSDLLSQRMSSDNVTIKVCVVDTGYQLGHPDLPNEASGYVEGINTGAGSWKTDKLGHGSHVAGTIAGIGNDFGVEGVNPSGSSFGLIVAKGLGDNGQGSASSIMQSIVKCAEMGARVINLSLGCSARFAISPCGSDTEEGFYTDLSNDGVLVVAAAGNAGNSNFGYPASYPSVMSVAAVGRDNSVASFSQFNEQVEISAPGVDILSISMQLSVKVVGNGESHLATKMEFSPISTVTAYAVDCGLGYSCQANGKVCLIERGEITFAVKATNCEKGGGVGVVIYNNIDGDLLGTLAGSMPRIPVVGISREAGLNILNIISQVELEVTTDISNNASYGYGSLSGTSMASPHVAGVAAKVWAYFPDCSNVQIRNALLKSAKMVNRSGVRCDHLSGYGVIQAKAAHDLLLEGGCEAGGLSESGAQSVGGCNQVNLSGGGVKSCATSFASCENDADCCSGVCRNGLFLSYCRKR